VQRLVSTRNFAFGYTLESAQPLTFYSDYAIGGGLLTFPYQKSIVSLRYRGDNKSGSFYLERSTGKSVFGREEASYLFRLGDDMERIYESISTDAFMIAAIEKYRGLRLTRNDPWVTTLTFIISQFNNIKRIRRIVKLLIERYGTDINDSSGMPVGKGFPDMETLSRLSVKELMECGTGFRAGYIKEASRYFTENVDLYKLEGKSYSMIKDALIGARGIGDKVADIIALMGYGKLEAFPIDTWIKRTVEKVYFNGHGKTVKEIHRFADERWGELAGYAQQYLYWHGMHSL
jgi:N-glycosylase/DNA lyase